MMPLTWGRTSAIMWGTVRPESSVVSVVFCGLTTMIPTSGGPLGGGAADFFLPQPVRVRLAARIPMLAITAVLCVNFINTSNNILSECTLFMIAIYLDIVHFQRFKPSQLAAMVCLISASSKTTNPRIWSRATVIRGPNARAKSTTRGRSLMTFLARPSSNSLR